MKKPQKSLVSALLCLLLLLGTVLGPVSPALAAGAPAQGGAALHLLIEGSAAAPVFSGDVTFTPGQSVCDILKAAADSAGFSLTLDTTYGSPMVGAIGGEPASGDFSRYWAFYINDISSDKGIAAVKPNSGDSVVLALTGLDSFYNDLTAYPLVSLSPAAPAPGQTVTVTVSRRTVDWSTGAVTFLPVEGAQLSFAGQTAATGGNGTASLTAPVSAGSYLLSVAKENPDASAGYPLLVRRSVQVTVSAAAPASLTVGVTDPHTISLASSPVSSVTVTGGGTLTLTASVASGTAQIGAPVSIDYRDLYRGARVDLPAGTITGAGWNGSITLSCPAAPSGTLPAGATATAVVSFGAAGTDLSLSGYARIVLPQQSGQSAGVFDAAGSFHPIATRLLSDTVPDGFAGPDAFYDNGADLIVYTRHCSQFVAYTPAGAAPDTGLAAMATGASTYLAANDPLSDWSVIAAVRAGGTAPAGYLPAVARTLADNGGRFAYPTQLARTILGLRAAGADPENFNSLNLIETLCSYPGLGDNGLNGPVYALLALDSGACTLPAGALWNRQSLVSAILAAQNTDGGFSLIAGSDSDVDMTAVTVTALSAHLPDPGVTDAINRAVSWLSAKQTATGGFIAFMSTAEASESTAQVVIALASAGIDPAADSRFIKNGRTPLDFLTACRNADGGFSHNQGDRSSDVTATQQSLMALAAETRLMQHANALFNLSDIPAAVTAATPAPEPSPTPDTAAAPAAENPKTGSDSHEAAAVGVLTSAAALLLLLRRRKPQQ